MEVVFILSAEIDWFDFYRHYGESFDQPIQKAIDRLKDHPELAPISNVPPIRKLYVQKTPWGIFYKPEGRRIVILAIEDLRRDPESIKLKLKGLVP